jgi:hypothetical protein
MALGGGIAGYPKKLAGRAAAATLRRDKGLPLLSDRARRAAHRLLLTDLWRNGTSAADPGP